ncbi:MAG: M36 family metallopeptidase [Bacteroidota bacterium]
MLKKLTILSLLVFTLSAALWSQAERPLQILDDHLKANHTELGLSIIDVSNYEVSSELVSQHNKLTHIYLQQSHDDIPVYSAILNANILPNGELLSMGNRFVADLDKKVNTTVPVISTAQAVGAVMSYFQLEGIEQLNLDRKLSDREYVYYQEGIALEPVRVHLMYQIMDDESVRLVWNVDLYELGAQHWWQARVDAISGEVVDYYDQVISCTFEHAEGEYCPEEERFNTANQKGHVRHQAMGMTSEKASLFLGDNENAYRVFPIPLGGPNYGERELVIDPADPEASPFGWHDTNGQEGAEFTITRGNNVHAYNDIYNLNMSIDDEPEGGDMLCFDFPLDLEVGRPYTQLNPTTTNLFYWNNVIHDFWHHYGFDEASGNFQTFNYTGAPGGNDYVQAETLDGSGTGNANFATPGDGSRPRMQMFLFDGALPDLSDGGVSNFDFDILAPELIQGTFQYTAASFGGTTPPGAPIVSQVVLVDDGVGVPSDGCQPFLNSDDIAGKIAMIDLGACQIGTKALAAQEAGAVAVMICNASSQQFDGTTLVPGNDGDAVTIPVFGVELPICNAMKIGLPDLEISVDVQLTDPFPIPMPGPTGRSSDFDNVVVAHEYAHGISIRLTGGRLNSGCLNRVLQPEQAGEGWSDFVGLVMTTTSANYPDQGRGIGTYAQGQGPDGGGFRSRPFSRSLLVNDIMYGDLAGLVPAAPTQDNVPVHAIGTVWCTILWDMYWNLVDVYGFDDDLQFGTGGNNIAMQLVLDGMKLQPCSPSFLEARNAILEADEANYGGANRCLIWETFARRGMGVNAQEGGIESFEVPISCPESFNVVKTGPAFINAGETITYELEITNGTESVVEAAEIIDALPASTSLVEGSSACELSLANGELTINLGDTPAETALNCSYQLETDPGLFSVPAFEDMVSNLSNWDNQNPLGEDTWGVRVNTAFTGIVAIYGGGLNVVSDQLLTLEEPVVLDGPNPGLSFYHLFSLESGFDGGVVEVSTDGGDNWQDVGAENFIENGYSSTLEASDNPLAERPAFTGTADIYMRSVVDLSAYAGETVLVRFRLGTDTGGGAREGWYLDDIILYSNLFTLTNTACTTSGGGSSCSDVVTIVNQGSVSTTEIDQDRPLKLFPNPASDKLTVELPAMLNEQVELSILAVDGRQLQSQVYDSFLRETLDLSALPAGIYMLQFRTAEDLTTRRLIVE